MLILFSLNAESLIATQVLTATIFFGWSTLVASLYLFSPLGLLLSVLACELVSHLAKLMTDTVHSKRSVYSILRCNRRHSICLVVDHATQFIIVPFQRHICEDRHTRDASIWVAFMH